MGNIVIDTSALIAAILDEPEKDRLIEMTEGATLIAPGSHRWELANAFSAMFKRGSLSLKAALAALEVYEGIPIRSIDVNLDRALEIASDLGIYAYDAYMIVCAMDYKAPLLTLDRALARQARSCGVSVPEI
jgi:predicted nucleic acid-binding protein